MFFLLRLETTVNTIVWPAVSENVINFPCDKHQNNVKKGN